MLLTHFYLKENKTRQGKQVRSPPFESFVVFSSKCVASRNQKKKKKTCGKAVHRACNQPEFLYTSKNNNNKTLKKKKVG